MIEIIYKPVFVRQYQKLLPALQSEVKEKVALFAENPNHLFLKTHKLKGRLKDRRSFSVNYQYRVVFRYTHNKKAAILLAVGDHQVYQI